MKILFHTLCSSILLLVGMSYSQAQNEPSALALQLIVPISNPEGQREIALDRYARIHVSITNVSQQDQRLWKDWNTWGYFNLTLEWRAGGKVYRVLKQAPPAWDGDFPDFWLLKPGEQVILEVDMRTGVWKGFPDLYGESILATLKATYENKADVLAKEFEIWVGKMETDELPVVLK